MSPRPVRPPHQRNPALCAAMATAGFSNRALAARLRVSENSVSRWVNLQGRPFPAVARLAAEALNSTPTALGWAESEVAP